jgi:hypothetical protein
MANISAQDFQFYGTPWNRVLIEKLKSLRNSLTFTEPGGLLPCSQELAAGSHMQSVRVNRVSPVNTLKTKK